MFTTEAATRSTARTRGVRRAFDAGTVCETRQINAAASNFKVSYAVTKTQNNYTVQHTANVYLIDPSGELVDVFTFSTPAEELMAAMR